MTLADIEKLTKDYADARGHLTAIVERLNDKLERAKRAEIGAIKGAVAVAKARQAKLQAAIEAEPALFGKPKTQIFHGVKVGYRKGSGKIEWEDDAVLVARIKKLLPAAQAELLIQTKEKPIAKALADLDAADLKRLGVTVEDTGEVVVIKPVDGDVDKLVAALLKDTAEEAEDAA
jgi:hypothetical protein